MRRQVGARILALLLTLGSNTRVLPRWFEAEVNRIAGEIALKSPEPDEAKAQAYFERALAVAREQQAKSWELRAAMSMARLWRDQGKRDADKSSASCGDFGKRKATPAVVKVPAIKGRKELTGKGLATPSMIPESLSYAQAATEAIMNEDVFNASIRKFLKALGVSAQREIEKAVRQALAEGKLTGNEKFPAKATVTLGVIGLSHEIKGEIELE